MWKRWLRAFWILFVCTIFCQSLLTSILALGWIYRWVGQRATRRLFALSPYSTKLSWSEWIRLDPERISLQDPPPLFRRQLGTPAPRHWVWSWIHFLSHSLWRNGKAGLEGILTTWSLTLFPCVIWSLAWYTGWQISFAKLYEESATGRSLGLLGIMIFAGVMLYVPIAQARHAVTGDWRGFFDSRMIKALICSRPIPLLLLSLGYLGASFVLLYFKAMPAFFLVINPDLETLSASEVLAHLEDYYFFAGAIGFLLVLILRSWAGRIYAEGLVKLWSRSRLDQTSFHEQERQLLKQLMITYGSCPQAPDLARRFLLSPLSLSYRGSLLLFTVLLWSFVGFLPFVSQFLHYYPTLGFLNQPLVQLPSFHYIPEDLKTAAIGVDP